MQWLYQDTLQVLSDISPGLGSVSYRSSPTSWDIGSKIKTLPVQKIDIVGFMPSNESQIRERYRPANRELLHALLP